MEWLKDLLKKWKIHITVVGGVVVIATAYGTCNYELPISNTLDDNTETELAKPAETE